METVALHAILSDVRGENDVGRRSPYNPPMPIAGQFIAHLQREQRLGNVSSETEQHLKHEFRKLGRNVSNTVLATAVEAEIDRLERQAATLRRLCDALSGVG